MRSRSIPFLLINIELREKKENGTLYWLEGTIEKRITKLARAVRLKYTENYFRIGQIRIINTWGDNPKPLPETV